VIQDASGICEYEVNVPVIIDPATVVDAGVEAGNIILYPNPTRDILNVEFVSFNEIHEVITVEVFDNSGRTVSSSQLSNDNNGITTISLSGLESGIYFVKCHNSTFDSYYKVVKM